MNNGDLQRIRHIKTYCEDIAETIARFGADYNTFVQDRDYCNSVSMSMMQIGEISGSLSDAFKSDTSHQMQWRAMKAMRNLFAHAYASMSKEMIWASATKDVPELLAFCNDVLAQHTEV